MKALSLAILFTIFIFTTGCSSDKKNPVTTYSDAEIAKVITTVNTSEIEMAEQVVSRSQNEEVREYAQEMINEHRANNKKTKEIMLEADMDFDDDSVKSQSLATMAEVDKKQLQYKDGKDFDREYLADQIETHKTVLTDLKETLIPQTKNEDLKAHLEETAEKIEGHLEQAQELERKIL